MTPRRSNAKNTLFKITIISLLIHVIGLIAIGSITLINAHNDKEESQMVAPPMVEPVPPPKQIPVQLSNKKPPQSSTKVIALDPRDMPLVDLDIDFPVIEPRSNIGRRGFGPGIGSGIDLKKLNLRFGGIRDRSESVCFIVDYSKSMKDPLLGSNMMRIDLLKKHLISTFSELDSQMMVSVIFFSGPAWNAGENQHAVRPLYTGGPNDMHTHRPKDFNVLSKPTWHPLNNNFRARIINIIDREPISGGTVWQNPIRLARALKPAPEVVYFLTDGATSDEDIEETLQLVSEWKRENRDLRIHTIALGEPRAEDGMRRIAGRTGGKFRLISSIEDIEHHDG
ncbi:vWA domain-containing protein [Cerasicoccus frondis]|uniref:vWA domain-containing protein n=1 Tax=Cerasicoccus frondis TaxID=490090 RepID=UPI0028528ED4|nr:vWA domain-containing protein [Cerasicoccus frondis]